MCGDPPIGAKRLGAQELQVRGHHEDARPLARRASRCCFVINLDRSRDRLRTISAQLEAAAIPYRRFSAVDGRYVDLDNTRVLDRNA